MKTPRPHHALIAFITTIFVVVMTACSAGSDNAEKVPNNGTVVPKESVWVLPNDPSAAAVKAGLPMFDAEQFAVHYHVHLDVIVDGQPITVPASIGIDTANTKFSPLHVHDTSGVVHIESATNTPFTLGQLFDEWGVVLTKDQLGDRVSTESKTVRVFVNGTQVDDPRNVIFSPHQQITVTYGTAEMTNQIPTSYQFRPGE